MTVSAPGAVLGLVFAAGVLLCVRFAPPLRRPSLSDRLAPYLGETAAPPRWSAGRALDGLLGGRRSVQGRLAALRSPRTVGGFRSEQLGWGMAAAVAVCAALAGRGHGLTVAVAAVAGLAAGVLGRDWWLTVQVRRRDERLLAELPVIAELLALAVASGEAPLAALGRACALCRGELADELATALAEARTGTPLPGALQALADRTSLAPLARFAESLVLALETGTPLADVLRAQAADARDAHRRALLHSGRLRELGLLVAVAVLTLPFTVLLGR